jgi:ribosome recycling factor
MLKGTNIIALSPFDENYKDSIIKGIQSSKLDVQIASEGNNIVVTLGDIPDDMKNESLQLCKKIQDSGKEELKNIRHQFLNEMKKLEKIIAKDEVKRIEKNVIEILEK